MTADSTTEVEVGIDDMMAANLLCLYEMVSVRGISDGFNVRENRCVVKDECSAWKVKKLSVIFLLSWLLIS